MWKKVENCQEERQFSTFAKRRIQDLLHNSMLQTVTLEALLASAYRQGVEDVVLVMDEKQKGRRG